MDIDSLHVAMGQRIKERRAAFGMSLQELAEKAGSSKAHIWALENGQVENPSIVLIMRVASALVLSLDELLGFDTTVPILSEKEMALIVAHRQIFGY